MRDSLFKSVYNFTDAPFSLVPDPDFLFWSAEHRKAFAVLEYGLLSGAQITVLTGEIGAGKTCLLRRLINDLRQDSRVGLLSNVHPGRGEILRWVLGAFDLPVERDEDPIQMFERFQNFVVETYAEQRRVVLVIDEAQNLGIDRLEEIRMLTNMNSDKDELLQLILVGQPELRQQLHDPTMRQFAQRVSVFFHLSPLDEAATSAYITHRLKCVGGTGDEIAPETRSVIFESSRGIPRQINKICDMALIYAASGDNHVVSLPIIEELLRDGLLFLPGGSDTGAEASAPRGHGFAAGNGEPMMLRPTGN